MERIIPHTGLPLYAIVIALLIVVMIGRRVPVLRTLISLGLWGTALVLLVVVTGQHARFDPYFARLTGFLKLDGQEVVGREVRIRMSPDGHFWAHADIGGVRRRMLIDSGATITALSTGTAAAAGLNVRDGLVPVLLRTANGTVSAQTATVDDLRLGDIDARRLSVVVSPAFGDADVLGMNFLSRLKSWRVEDGTLILVPHHPQATAQD